MNLYVGNLSSRVREAELHMLFEGQGFGKIIAIKEANPASPGSSGYAIIELSDRVQANVAVRLLNGRKLRGQSLVVRTIEGKNWNHAWFQQLRHEVPMAVMTN